ncbi:MAG: hypothetical protein RLZZ358_1204, partial [Bacteroidota bacterium]
LVSWFLSLDSFILKKSIGGRMKNWTKVFEDQNQIRVEIVKGVLEDKGVAAFVLNKKESIYQVIGTYEVLVPTDQTLYALQLIQHEITF